MTINTIYLFKVMNRALSLLIGGIVICLYSGANAQVFRDQDGTTEKANKAPKDTIFQETIKPVDDMNGDGVSDYVYTYTNGKGKLESTIIEGKRNGDTSFGWHIGLVESLCILIGSIVSILATILTALWLFYNRLDKKIVSVRTEIRTEMKEEAKASEERLNKEVQHVRIEMKASEERLNKRMDKAEVEIKEIKDTLATINQTLMKIETRLNTEERFIQILNNKDKSQK